MTKLISFTLSFLFLLSVQLQAQDWNETTFEGGVYRSSFDETNFDRIVKEGDKAYLYFNTQRTGAIKSKGIMGNKADKLESLVGLMEVILGADGKVEKTTHRFFEHETVLTTKGLEYLATVPAGFTDSPRLLAQESEIIEGSKASVEAVFPNYFKVASKAVAATKAAEPEVYYDNKLKYKGLRRGVESFLQKKSTLKAEGEKSKIGKFLFDGAFDYNTESTVIEIEDYRDSSKEITWSGAYPSTSDKMTGNVYNVHQKFIKKGKWRSYLEYEFVTFNKDGKMANRVDKKFEIPTVYKNTFTTYSEDENGFNTTDKKLYIMQDYNMMGMGVKKEFGDRIKANRRHIIQTNAAGVEEISTTIMPEGNIDFIEAYQNVGKEMVLIGKSYPFGMQFITLKKDAEPQTYAYSISDDLLKGFGPEEKNVNGYKWKVAKSMSLEDGKRMIVFDLMDEVSIKGKTGTSPTKENHFMGWFYVVTDGAGQPIKSYRLLREGDNMKSKGLFVFIGDFGDNMKFMVKDPIAGGAAVSILTINKSDFNTSKKTVGNLKKANFLIEDGMFYLVGEQIPNPDIKPEDRRVIYSLVTSKL